MSVSDNPVAQTGFQDFEPTGTVQRESVSDIIRVPGFWEADQECEQIQPVGFCEGGHVQFGGESPCGTRTCPHHWGQWRKRAAANLVARFAAYRLAQPDGADRRALHVVASPEQEQRWTLNRFWQARSGSYDAVEEAGGRGGVTIPHAYRTSDAADELFRDWLGGEVAQERGKWRVLREYAADWEEMKEFVEVAPHSHTLTPARDIDGDTVEEIEEETGWAVHNVRSLAPVYLDESAVPQHRTKVGDNGRILKDRSDVVREGFADMGRLAMYLLSHAAVQPAVGEEISARATVTYWGEVHPNAFDPSEAFSEEAWARIQRLAAQAVGHELDEDTEEGEDVCWRDDCDAPTVPIWELTEYLSGVREYEGWFGGLDREQQHEMVGLMVYLGDRPPPGQATENLDGGGESHDLPPGGFQRSGAYATPHEIRGDREAFAEWLRRIGRGRVHKFPALEAQIGELWDFFWAGVLD